MSHPVLDLSVYLGVVPRDEGHSVHVNRIEVAHEREQFENSRSLRSLEPLAEQVLATGWISRLPGQHAYFFSPHEVDRFAHELDRTLAEKLVNAGLWTAVNILAMQQHALLRRYEEFAAEATARESAAAQRDAVTEERLSLIEQCMRADATLMTGSRPAVRLGPEFIVEPPVRADTAEVTVAMAQEIGRAVFGPQASASLGRVDRDDPQQRRILEVHYGFGGDRDLSDAEYAQHEEFLRRYRAEIPRDFRRGVVLAWFTL